MCSIDCRHVLGRRRRSHSRCRVDGRQRLGLALVLVHEMPHTLAALTHGEISEWRATLVARETAVLSKAHRARADAELAGQLSRAGDKKTAQPRTR